MRTVIEFPEFIKKVASEFGLEEREEIVSFLSANPKAGQRLKHFGGLRKLEWFKKGKKSEVNIYFHPGANNLPLVVISMFRKNEKLILEKIVEILIHSKINQL